MASKSPSDSLPMQDSAVLQPTAKRRVQARPMAWVWTGVVAALWLAISWPLMGPGTGLEGGVFLLLSGGLVVLIWLGYLLFFVFGTHAVFARVGGPIAIGISLGLGAFLLASPALNRWGIQRATERGDRIIRALDNFRSEHGAYPERLRELTPKYLPSIPSPYSGLLVSSTFDYVGHGESLSLYFSTGLFCGYEWNRERGWLSWSF